jgi:hypothetical protein
MARQRGGDSEARSADGNGAVTVWEFVDSDNEIYSTSIKQITV